MSREVAFVAMGSLLTAAVGMASAYMLGNLASLYNPNNNNNNNNNDNAQSIDNQPDVLTNVHASSSSANSNNHNNNNENPQSPQQVQAPNADETNAEDAFDWNTMSVADVLKHINQKDALHLSVEMIGVYASVFEDNMLTNGAMLKARKQAWCYWTQRINGVPSGLIHALASSLGLTIDPPKRTVRRSSREITVSLRKDSSSDVSANNSINLGEHKGLNRSPPTSGSNSPMRCGSRENNISISTTASLSSSSSSSGATLTVPVQRNERLRRASSNPVQGNYQNSLLLSRGKLAQTIHELDEKEGHSSGNDSEATHQLSVPPSSKRASSLTEGDLPTPGSPVRVKSRRSRHTRSDSMGSGVRALRSSSSSFLDLIDENPLEAGAIDVASFLKSDMSVSEFRQEMETYMLSNEERAQIEKEKKEQNKKKLMGNARFKSLVKKTIVMNRHEHAIGAMTDMFRTLKAHRKLLGVASLINSDTEERKALQNITASVHNIVQCERVTFFFVDHEKGVFRIDFHETDPDMIGVTLPLNTGVVGRVASSGKIVNLKDPYESSLFNSDVDKETGFTTRNMVAVPVLNQTFDDSNLEVSTGRRASGITVMSSHKVVGVIQMLNKLDADGEPSSDGFTEEDETMLRYLAQLASQTIHNVTLYEEAQVRQRRLDSLIKMIDAINANSFRGTTSVAQSVINSACSVVSDVGLIVLYLVKETKHYLESDDGEESSDTASSSSSSSSSIAAKTASPLRKRRSGRRSLHGNLPLNSDAMGEPEYTLTYTLVPLACSDHAALADIPSISDGDSDRTCVKLLRSAADGTLMNLRGPNTTDRAYTSQLIVPIKDDVTHADLNRRASALSGPPSPTKALFEQQQQQQQQQQKTSSTDNAKVKRQLSFRTRATEAKKQLSQNQRFSRSDSPVLKYALQHHGEEATTAESKSASMNTVAVLHVVNKQGGSFTAFDEVLFRSLASCAAQALKKAQIYGALIHEQTKSYALLSLLQAQDEASRGKKGLVHITRTIIQVAQSVLGCEKMGLFFVDRVREQLFCTVSTDSSGFSISINSGIVGQVARTGMPLNVVDAKQCSFHDGSRDVATGTVTKSVLSHPIKDQSGVTIAILQAINKVDPDDQVTVGVPFDTADMEMMEAICTQVGITLRRCLTEVLVARSNIDGEEEGNEGEMNSLLSVYGITEKKAKSMDGERKDAIKRASFVAHADLTRRWSKSLTNRRIDDGVQVTQLLDPNFCVLDYGALELVQFAATMFEDLGVLKTFEIPKMVLQNFLERIRTKYADNPYHNWHHGFAVLWFAYYVLRKTRAASIMTPTDILVLLVAAVCHDVDHTGFTNSYEVAAQSGLALTYNDKSVLENHHCFVTFEVLRQPDCNIFSKDHAPKAAEVFSAARSCIIQCILATDMVHHFDMCKRMDNWEPRCSLDAFDHNSREDVQFLLDVITHTADLSNQCLSRDSALKWSELVTAEFRSQNAHEKKFNLAETPFMKDLDKPEVKYRGQVNFIDFVVHPLWKGAVQLFPELSEFKQNLLANRHTYKHLAEHPDLTPEALTPQPLAIRSDIQEPLLEGNEEEEEEEEHAATPPAQFSNEN